MKIISKESKMIAKFQFFGVHSIEEMHSIYKQLSSSENPIEELDKLCLEFHSPTKMETLSDLQIQSIRFYLSQKKNSNEIDTISSSDLKSIFTRKIDQSRMLPNSINFQKKDWMIFDTWIRFDPITSAIMLFFWAILYSLIFYFIY